MRFSAVPFVAAGLAVAATSFASTAFAQTTAGSIVITVASRIDNIRQRGPAGTLGVSKQDCLDDLTLGFNLSITGQTTTYDLQVWAGEGDCSTDANRLGTTAICKPVAPTSRTTSAALSVPVRVRDLVADLEVKPKPVSYSAADATACDAQSSPGARTLSVWFLLLNGSSVIASSSFKTTATGTTGTTTTGTSSQEGVVVDLKGPPAVTNVSASSGDRRLRLEWTPTGDQDARGYVFYCQPASAAPVDASATSSSSATPTTCDAAVASTDAAATDAGADADAAAPIADAAVDDSGCSNAGGTTATTCPSPTISAATECGRILSKTNTGFTDRSLTNLVAYAVAVAPLDAFDNVGDPASVTQCVAPEAVNDFWKAYNEAGGQAGGFCALEAAGLPAGTNAATFGVGVGVFALVGWRRRIRRKMRSTGEPRGTVCAAVRHAEANTRAADVVTNVEAGAGKDEAS